MKVQGAFVSGCQGVAMQLLRCGVVCRMRREDASGASEVTRCENIVQSEAENTRALHKHAGVDGDALPVGDEQV